VEFLVKFDLAGFKYFKYILAGVVVSGNDIQFFYFVECGIWFLYGMGSRIY
jgi:hypothetical protein